jgi:cell filamentation protein
MADDPYVDPATGLLRNKLNISDQAAFDRAERRLVAQRYAEGAPSGGFDLAHLRAIHRHLFQDVFDWAGELRTVEIAKGDTAFQPLRFLEVGMADVHRRLAARNFLVGLDSDQFASAVASIVGDINHAHPFREGNGRAQLVYLKLLATQAGHRLDLRRIRGPEWMVASRAAHLGDYAPIAASIRAAIGT